jgi:glycosyltransferase involved in cell wall biosynthesis
MVHNKQDHGAACSGVDARRVPRMSKRILVVSCNLPFPPDVQTHGVFQRLDLFLRAAAQLGLELDCLFLAPPELATETVSDQIRAALSDRHACDVTVTVARMGADPTRSFQRELLTGCLGIRRQRNYAPLFLPVVQDAIDAALARHPDLVLAHRLPAMVGLLKGRRSLPPVLFDLDDVEHRALYRMAMAATGWWAHRLRVAQVPAVAVAEVRAIRRAAQTFVCSEIDRRRVLRLVGGKGTVTALPNTVVVPTKPIAEWTAPLVLFVGSFTYEPNRQAANELSETIWPLIRREMPAAQLFIAGKNPEGLAASSRARDGVRVLGFVPSLQDLYRRAAVMCCPIRAGSGTRVKIIEAAGNGVPVVSTTLGAEGLDYIDGREILLRDTPEALAGACVALLKDAQLRRAIGQAGHAKTVALYDRTFSLQRLQGIMTTTLGTSP